MPCPYQVCSSFDEAYAWVQKKAVDRGLVVPAIPNLWNV